MNMGGTFADLGIQQMDKSATSWRNTFQNFLLQENQTENQKSLANNAFNLNQRSLVESPSNSVAGLAKAGLNPALMNNGAYTQAPTLQAGAAAGASTTTPTSTLGATNSSLNIAEAENQESQAGVNAAEQERIMNMNREWLDKNITSQNMGKIVAKQLMQEPWFKDLDETLKDQITKWASGENPLSIGGLQGFVDGIKASTTLSDANKQLAENTVQYEVLMMQLKDKGILNAIAKMPEAQRAHIFADITKLQNEATKLFSDAMLNSSTAELNDEKIDEIKKDLEQKWANDPTMLWKEGKYGAATVQEVRHIRDQVLSALVNGAMIYAGVKGVKGTGGVGGLGGAPIPNQKTNPKSTIYKEGLGDWTANQGKIDPNIKKAQQNYAPYRSESRDLKSQNWKPGTPTNDNRRSPNDEYRFQKAKQTNAWLEKQKRENQNRNNNMKTWLDF